MNKTVVLTSNAYFPSIGGIENSLRHLAIEAKNCGNEPIIVVADIGLKEPLKKVVYESIDDVQVIRYPLYPIRSPILRWLNLLVSSFVCWTIFRKIFRDRPDAVVIARFHFNAVLAVWAGFKRVRYLVPSIVKQQYEVELKGVKLFKRIKGILKIKMHNWVQRNALLKCKNFVFSETMRSQSIELAKNLQEDYRLVKPGIDPYRFYPLTSEARRSMREEHGIPLEKTMLLFVGRFVKAKGVHLIIDAMSLSSQSNLHLVLVGDGVEKSKYLEMIDKYNLQDSVTILPPCRSVEEYYQMADAFVMSSSYEPLGQTILEAFASGLNVIAFKSSEFVNTATEELGMDEAVEYVKDYSSKSLSLAFNSVGDHSYERSKEISTLALKKFSWLTLLTELINK